LPADRVQRVDGGQEPGEVCDEPVAARFRGRCETACLPITSAAREICNLRAWTACRALITAFARSRIVTYLSVLGADSSRPST